MQITYKGDYALKAILYLSMRYDTSVVPMHELAKELDIPLKFLEQILLELKKGGFVESKRGINGGYSLMRHPKEITIGQAIRFIDGPTEPIACVETKKKYKGCNEIERCVLREVWSEVARRINDVLDKVTFDELCSRMTKATPIHYAI